MADKPTTAEFLSGASDDAVQADVVGFMSSLLQALVRA